MINPVNMRRLFIGVPVESGGVVSLMKSWQNDPLLNRSLMKWVNPENWHLTLVFLGTTPESAIEELQQIISDAFGEVEAFTSDLSGVGIFPDLRNPKVLWIGLKNLQVLLPSLSRLAELLRQGGFAASNKPLKPHLTLARIKSMKHRPSFDALLNQYNEFNFGPVSIDRIILYESLLTPLGPVYQPLFVKLLDTGQN